VKLTNQMRWSTFCETNNSLDTQEIPVLKWNLKILLQVHNISELQITSYKWDEQNNEKVMKITKSKFVKYINQFA